MLIDLPGRYSARQAALAWLAAEGIGHIVLFQQVKVHDADAARRFKAWLDVEA